MPLLLCILFSVLAAAAQGKTEGDYFAALTYAESVQLALQKNFAIEGASFDPLIGRAQLRSSEGKFDPALTLAYTRDDNEEDLTGLNVTTAEQLADGLLQPGLLTRNTRDFAEANVGGLTPWGMT